MLSVECATLFVLGELVDIIFFFEKKVDMISVAELLGMVICGRCLFDNETSLGLVSQIDSPTYVAYGQNFGSFGSASKYSGKGVFV